MKYLKYITLLVLVGFLPVMLFSTGTVYLVLGSDTAIWDGMSVNRYNCTYNQSLYTDPLRNAYTVMDPTFRAQYTDSYGQPMKMTWWMMAGNIFRYATNNNFPVPNIMTLYLMQKYHGENVMINDDELSLHYHTFFWSDYDQDGTYYWNQSLTFEENREDWNTTLAQFLLEEDVFPVSFRSGWHYMDNDWQHELNKLLPYSMHNAWPAKRVDLTEPMDNTYDWSESPSEFIPFRPSLENYMVDGDGPGWNVRSASFQQVIRDDLMDSVFAHASTSKDQMACFWAHLPENDFPDNMANMDQLAHAAAEKYPGVNFKYCTAIEAMQIWRKTQDTTGPDITVMEQGNESNRYYTISSSEPLFMPQPFVALKYKDESYTVLACDKISDTEWNTNTIPNASELAKLGVAATDTVGNLTTAFKTLVPDDIYIDNVDPEYIEYSGLINNSADAAWGTDSRIAQVDASNPLRVAWQPLIEEAAFYHIFVQVPDSPSAGSTLDFVVNSSTGVDTVTLQAPLPANEWIYLSTPFLNQGQNETLELVSQLPDSLTSASIPIDVVKFTAMVRDREIRVSTNIIDYGEISLDHETFRDVKIRNQGLETLTIQNIESSHNLVTLAINTPLVIEGMQEIPLSLRLYPSNIGLLTDTLTIYSDDPLHPRTQLIITADVQYPFQIIDNENTELYDENGVWFTSVAQALGNSSRYAWLNSGASASFTLEPENEGIYKVLEIVPKTINSTDDALYILNINGIAIDSVYLDQNLGSGQWVEIGTYFLPFDAAIQLEVHDTGNSTVGAVLRADGIKIQMLDPTNLGDDQYLMQSPSKARLYQNYPNPFNPSTTIRYSLPEAGNIDLLVYDLRGTLIRTLASGQQSAGAHHILWDGTNQAGEKISTGVYFCRIQVGEYRQTVKMLYLK